VRYAIYARPLAEGPARSGVRVSRWFKSLLPAIGELRRLLAYTGHGRAHTWEYRQEPPWARGPFVDFREYGAHAAKRAARRAGQATVAALLALYADLETLVVPEPITVGGRIWPPQRGPYPKVAGGAGWGLPGAPAGLRTDARQPQPQERTARDALVAAMTRQRVGEWWAGALTPEERERGEWIARHWWPELFGPPEQTPLAWSETVAEVARLGGPISVTYDFFDAEGNIVAMDGPTLTPIRGDA
jgi:hypothetical protein